MSKEKQTKVTKSTSAIKSASTKQTSVEAAEKVSKSELAAQRALELKLLASTKHSLATTFARGYKIPASILANDLNPALVRWDAKSKKEVPNGEFIDQIIRAMNYAVTGDAVITKTLNDCHVLAAKFMQMSYNVALSKIIPGLAQDCLGIGLVQSAKLAKFFAVTSGHGSRLILFSFAKLVEDNIEQIRLGKVKVTTTKGDILSGPKLLQWLNRAPDRNSSDHYFARKFMFYLPGFIVND